MRTWFINVAVSFDTKIALPNKMVNISSEEDWRVVHHLRNTIAAIVVGSNTIKIDNPTLLTQQKYLSNKANMRHPIRIVLDKSGNCDPNSNVFQHQNLSQTIWVTGSSKKIPGVLKIQEFEIGSLIKIINIILDRLDQSGDVMIEGGANVITSFVNSGFIKNMRLYRSSIILPQGKPLFPNGITRKLNLFEIKRLGPGIEENYRIK